MSFLKLLKKRKTSADLIDGGRLLPSLGTTISKARSSLVLKYEERSARRP